MSKNKRSRLTILVAVILALLILMPLVFTIISASASAASKTSADELKALAATLGANFSEDSENINGGYPILAWQGAKQPLAGDVNADGEVTVADAELVYNYSIGAGELTEAELLIADMDGDGYITAKDAAMIYAIIAAALAAVTE